MNRMPQSPMVKELLRKSKPKTNVAKTLVALLRSRSEWTDRRTLTDVIPSATARVRELRARGFEIACSSESSLVKRLPKSKRTGRPTFYSLNMASVTPEKVKSVLEGVV